MFDFCKKCCIIINKNIEKLKPIRHKLITSIKRLFVVALWGMTGFRHSEFAK